MRAYVRISILCTRVRLLDSSGAGASGSALDKGRESDDTDGDPTGK